MTYETITTCDVDIRKDLYSNVILQEVPPCTQVFQRDSRKSSMQCAQLLTLSRSLPHKTDTTQCGQVDQLFAHSLPSRPNGSPRTNTRRPVSRLFTPNAYEQPASIKSIECYSLCSYEIIKQRYSINKN